MSVSRYLSKLAALLSSSGIVTAAGGGTGLSSPGDSGNVLTSDGSVWTSAAPAGGGSGSAILGYAYSNAASAGLNMTVMTDIPGMSVTFTLAADKDVQAAWQILLNRSSGVCRVIINVDGVDYVPSAGSNYNFYSISQNENNMQQSNAGLTIPLAAGTHTIKLRANDALSNATTTFGPRSLRLTQLN